MSDNAAQITQGHCVRVGTVAVDKKWITSDDLHKALKIQVQDDLEVKPHRLIGDILFFDLCRVNIIKRPWGQSPGCASRPPRP